MPTPQTTIESKVESTIDLVLRTIQATDPETLQRLVNETLEPILALSDKIRFKLIDTIEATHLYNRTKAAKVLNVSTKTLAKRWHHIEQLTGLHLNLPADRLQLDLALYCLRLLQTNGQSGVAQKVPKKGTPKVPLLGSSSTFRN